MNVNKLKRILLYFLIGIVPFFIFIGIYMGFENNPKVLLYSGAGFIISLFLLIFLSNFILNNVFYKLVEGDGNLILQLDSSGQITTYLFKSSVPYIETKIDNKEIKQKFSRELINYITKPIDTKTHIIQLENGDMVFYIKKEDYNKHKYRLGEYNVIIYNKMLNSFITKDFFQEKEKQSFLEYLLINFHDDLINTDKTLTNLFRYLGDQFNKKNGLFEILKNPFVVVIIIIVFVLFVYMLAPYFIKNINTAKSTLDTTIGGVNNGIIQPIK